MTKVFAQGLERFADMLSAPLFSAEAVLKERQAIEAEFSMKLKDDGRSDYQAHKETINPCTSLCQVFGRQFATLWMIELNNQHNRPFSSFISSQYSASRMTLVIG
ncbi:MAG: hypothetical protein U5L01_16770 [Rheinheimera sp.]|nr:hypothetical protein [Rheinheimera sp.]